eukprot:3007726-Pleurochrysis_carterae.AAC.4
MWRHVWRWSSVESSFGKSVASQQRASAADAAITPLLSRTTASSWDERLAESASGQTRRIHGVQSRQSRVILAAGPSHVSDCRNGSIHRVSP